MLDVSLVMLGAGNSTRFEMPTKKQWLRIEEDPLWLYATKNLCSFYTFKDIIVVSKECKYMQKFTNDYKFIEGGETRQDSLKNALEHVNSEFVLVSDIARPCVCRDMFIRIIDTANLADCVIPILNVADTTYLGDSVVDRKKIKLVQTPQLSRTQILKDALQVSKIYTDDSSAIANLGGKISYVLGDEKARKITTKSDLTWLNLPAPSKDIFTGNGFDVHKFASNRELWLCGEKIDYELGLLGHSDADVGLHALTDAILGAVGLGDIGELYPDNDPKFKGIDSKILLKDAYTKVQNLGFELVNVDVTIMAQKPKISAFKAKMEQNIAKTLGISGFRINVKATTTENLGFVGRCEGIAAMASANLKYYDWTKI